MKGNKSFLYIGLSILAAAFVVQWTDGSLALSYALLGIAIIFKVIFLINVFRAKGFRPNPGFYMILIGVTMILTSLLFKKLIPIPILQKLLFGGAIALKIFGVVLMIIDSKK